MSGKDIRFSNLEFNPGITMDSGQTFRWTPIDHFKTSWMGIISDKIVKVTKEGATILGEFESERNYDFILEYFSPRDNIDGIFSKFPTDRQLNFSRNELAGLRLLTQEPWECLISFVCSINCNIPSIHSKIENLSKRFGRRIPTSTNVEAYSFPHPSALSRASERDLLSCKLGFRWKYVKFIAKKVESGELDLNGLHANSYSEAHSKLLSISGNTLGVGPKVADCALLYSLHKTCAFPIDVWMFRCLRSYYPSEIQFTGSLTPKRYSVIAESMRKRFGIYAGYAQLYLYVWMRNQQRTIRNTMQA